MPNVERQVFTPSLTNVIMNLFRSTWYFLSKSVFRRSTLSSSSCWFFVSSVMSTWDLASSLISVCRDVISVRNSSVVFDWNSISWLVLDIPYHWVRAWGKDFADSHQTCCQVTYRKVKPQVTDVQIKSMTFMSCLESSLWMSSPKSPGFTNRHDNCVFLWGNC